MNEDYWDHLIQGHLDDMLNDAERSEFEVLMLESAAARRRFWQLAEVHGLAREAVRLAWGARSEPAASPAVAEVCSRVNQPPRRLNWLSWRPLAAAMTVSLFLAAILTAVFLTQASASPAAILRQALKVHAAALDRCYRLEVKREPIGQETSRRPAMLESRLWTRGDRFWIETRAGEQTVAWGRDEQGRVWFTTSPEMGAWFDPDEVPKHLAQMSELRSLQVESLLRSLLADFDLRREPDAAGGYVVHAELKPGHEHPRYRAALLVVDGLSGVLRRVDVQRVRPGQSPVPVNFTLVETGLQDDASYTLAGHLSEQAVIYDRHSAPGKRGTAFAEFLRLLWDRPSRP